ncbi:MAG: TlpA disulfide reductase family protein [Candidatus Omnitrophota bacterium]
MKKCFKFFLITGIIFFTGISCIQVKNPEGSEKEVALDFKLQDLSKNSVALSDYRGKNPVAILFWTTWCPYCRVELNNLNQKYPQLAKEGWEVLAIDVEESSFLVEAFLKKRPLTFKVLLDLDAQVAHSYGLLGVPTFILVNKEGFVVFKDNYFPEDRYRELILK